MKKFEYTGNVNNLINGLRQFEKDNDSIQIKITDTTGTAEASYSYYLTVAWKSKIGRFDYDIVLHLPDKNSKQDKVQIGLVGAHDFARKIGGYHLTDSDVDIMAAEFEQKLLPELAYREGIYITEP